MNDSGLGLGELPAGEAEAFRRLQARLGPLFRRVFPDPRTPRSVVVIPSLSLDREVLAKVNGAHHYEERLLCLLLLLRLPRTNVVFVTSTPIHEAIIDYYLHLLPGIPAQHARRRLTLLSCHDSALEPLSAKILARPRLLEKILAALPDPAVGHITCFNVSELERRLALRLDLPVYGCDPALLHLGTKSGSRRLFRDAGVDLPDGFEDLGDAAQVGEALAALKARNPQMRRAVVKLNDGFSGEGNAVFRFDEDLPKGAGLEAWVHNGLPRLAFEASGMTWEIYREKIAEMGAIVEAFVEGEHKRSPSAQYRVDPLGNLEVVSTHDQELGGRSGQIFLGCRFPADQAYRLEIQSEGLKAARALAAAGVIGRFGVDFVSVLDGETWRHYAIEVNLRKGGTTHPFLMLQFLTDGHYDPESGLYYTPTGRPTYYYASDNLESPHYRGLSPGDLVDISVMNGLHYHGASQEGVVFHLIGALSEFGKLGIVCVAASHQRATELQRETIAILDRESQV